MVVTQKPGIRRHLEAACNCGASVFVTRAEFESGTHMDIREITRSVLQQPVRVEGRAIVYDPSKMEDNKIYSVEVLGRLHLVRKIAENTVETYELEPIE